MVRGRDQIESRVWPGFKGTAPNNISILIAKQKNIYLKKDNKYYILGVQFQTELISGRKSHSGLDIKTDRQ
jgi:hypothetical protein